MGTELYGIKTAMVQPLLSLVGAMTLLFTPASAYVPFGQGAVDSGLALAGLNSQALINSLGNFRSGCNPAQLKVRQEWYVTSSTAPPKLASKY